MTSRNANFAKQNATTVVSEATLPLSVDLPTRRNRQTPRNTPKSPANTPAGVQRYVEVTPEREPPEDEEHIPLHSVEGGSTPPINVQLDTGAAVTIISEKECKKLFGNTLLKRSELLLRRTASSDRHLGRHSTIQGSGTTAHPHGGCWR